MASEKRKRSPEAATATEQRRLARENRTLRRQLEACREECATLEKRVGQSLHDGVCQDLSAAAFYLQALKTQMERNNTASVSQCIQHLSDSVKRAVDSTHALSRDLRK